MTLPLDKELVKITFHLLVKLILTFNKGIGKCPRRNSRY